MNVSLHYYSSPFLLTSVNASSSSVNLPFVFNVLALIVAVDSFILFLSLFDLLVPLFTISEFF